MSQFEIKLLDDVHECETCGTTFADGYLIFHEGNLVSEKQPVAHCLSVVNHDREDALIEIINMLGHHVTVEYDQGEENEERV